MDKQWMARWVTDSRYASHPPQDVFHKQQKVNAKGCHREDLVNQHMLVRKTFLLESVPASARLDISADDYYKVYINGQFVGQGPAPSYYFHYYYNRYDVQQYLNEGENILAVHVYYQGLINRVWNSGDYRQGVIAELIADSGCLAATDGSWRFCIGQGYHSGGILGYNTQFLEDIDSRELEHGWREQGFDDSHWGFVWVHTADDHKLFEQPTPPVSVYPKEPSSVQTLSPGHVLLDFGQEITGQFRLSLSGQPGETVEIRCGEELEDNRLAVRYAMRCGCKYQEFWTLAGIENEELEFFDYKAFRYVEVLAASDTLANARYWADVRHYPLDPEACTLTTDNALVQSVWDICKAGVQYGCQEGYLDCPTREKGQYLGDATVTGHSHIYVSGDLRLYRKALEDFALSSFVCPGLLAVAPGAFMQEIADYSLQWPQQLLLYYEHSGDRQFLRAMYPHVQRLVEYFDGYRRQDGLLENVTEKWNLVDWPANLRDGYDFPLEPLGSGAHNVVNAFYVGMRQTVQQIEAALGLPTDDDVPELVQAFCQAFYDKKQRLFVDAEHSDHASLHANVLPLLYGLVPSDVEDRVVDLIMHKRLACGVYFAYFALKALAKAKRVEEAYSLIDNSDAASWGNMVREGATTCMEAWGREQKWNTSWCHAWASAPISVLIEDVFGVRPGSPGWNTIRFRPRIPAALGDCALTITIPYGQVSVQRRGDVVTIQGPDDVPIERL